MFPIVIAVRRGATPKIRLLNCGSGKLRRDALTATGSATASSRRSTDRQRRFRVMSLDRAHAETFRSYGGKTTNKLSHRSHEPPRHGLTTSAQCSKPLNVSKANARQDDATSALRLKGVNENGWDHSAGRWAMRERTKGKSELKVGMPEWNGRTTPCSGRSERRGSKVRPAFRKRSICTSRSFEGILSGLQERQLQRAESERASKSVKR